MCTPLVIFIDTPMRGTTIAHCMCIDRQWAAQADKVVEGGGRVQVYEYEASGCSGGVYLTVCVLLYCKLSYTLWVSLHGCFLLLFLASVPLLVVVFCSPLRESIRSASSALIFN